MTEGHPRRLDSFITTVIALLFVYGDIKEYIPLKESVEGWPVAYDGLVPYRARSVRIKPRERGSANINTSGAGVP